MPTEPLSAPPPTSATSASPADSTAPKMEFPPRVSPCPPEPWDIAPGVLAFEDTGAGCPNCREGRIYRSEILGRLWARADLLIWSTKDEYLPPLLTASPPGTLPADTGVIGLPGTSVLFGDEDALGQMRLGGKLTGGFWWNPGQEGGIEASYFELADLAKRGTFSSTDNPLMARPFIDVTTGLEASRLTAYPGILDGDILLNADTIFSGAELLLRQSIGDAPLRRVYLVGGYRYLRLADRLGTHESLLSLDAASGYPAGTAIDRSDQFNAISNFHGGEAGVIARWWRNRFSLELFGKAALGATVTDVVIDGETITQAIVNGQPVVTPYPGGVLALPSNMGTYHSGSVAWVGEVGARLDWAIMCNLRASVGYNFLYWSRVGRAADQIDRVVNPTQFPPGTLVGPARPQFDLKTTDFWAQGLSLGLECQF